MTEIRGWFRDNSTLAYFLFAQSVVLAGAGASALAYFTNLENRVHTMEVRGAAYTVARMDEMKLAIARLEQSIEKNEDQIKLIREVMTRRLNINP
jgi:hypothetical protein